MDLHLAGPTTTGPGRAAAARALTERVADLLRRDDHTVHVMQEDNADGVTERLANALDHICQPTTDAVIAVPGWRDNRQARAQVAAAHAVHKPVYSAEAFVFLGVKAPRLGNND